MESWIFIPLSIVGGPVAIVLIVLHYRYRQARARYDMLVQLADKGAPLAPELLVEPALPLSERRRGLVLVSAALGLMAMLLVLPLHFDSGRPVADLWGIGLLPLLTGLGYLASWWLDRRAADA